MALLPTTKTPIEDDIGMLKILLYGAPKSGKTTLCAEFPNAVFLATEPGLTGVEAYQVAVKDWTMFQDACKELLLSKHDFRTVIVDTTDRAFAMCRDKILKDLRVSHETDLPYGKGFSAVKDAFRRPFEALSEARKFGVVFVSHARDEEYQEIEDPRTGKKRMQKVAHISPTLAGAARKIIGPMADVTLYLSPRREIVAHPPEGEDFECGARGIYAARLPDIIKPCDYQTLAACLRGEVTTKGLKTHE